MSEETLVVSKPAWASKGIIGSVVVIAVSAMSLASVFIPSLRDIEINKEGLVEAISGALTLVFGAVALWGRIKAKAPVHFINRKTVPGGEFNPEAEVRRAQPANAERSTLNTQHRRGGNTKNGSTLVHFLYGLALVVVLSFFLTLCGGCAGRPDRTPSRHETSAVINTTAKVAWTPVVFGTGVVTWPFVVWVIWPDPAAFVWPGWLVTYYWEEA